MPEHDQAPRLLVLNAGSSSLKFGLYAFSKCAPVETFGGSIHSEQDKHRIELTVPQRSSFSIDAPSPLAALYSLPEIRSTPKPAAVGHRVVHGGLDLCRHTRIDDSVLKQLEAATVFAPLHVPPALKLIHDARERFPDATQVACLDTVFHSSMPDVASTLPLPSSIRKQGIRRMGFHGLSCESVVHALGDRCPARLVIAHLGSGCSVTAVDHGKSVDTSMGLTPTGGVLMSTRPGDLDPGVLLYLLRSGKYSVSDLEHLLEYEAGLAGLSENSGDVRVLEHDLERSDAAALALAQFVRSVAKCIAGMVLALRGAELVVFTGGVGENAVAIRHRIIAELAPLFPHLSSDVVASRENDCIAKHTWHRLKH